MCDSFFWSAILELTETHLNATFFKNSWSTLVTLSALIGCYQWNSNALYAALTQDTGNIADDSSVEASNGRATIQGSLRLESEINADFDWQTMQGSLLELVTLQQPVLPDDFQTRSILDRQQWRKDYFQTVDGQELKAANQEILDNRHVHDFRIRKNGKFVIYDVPKGRFEIRITGQTTFDEQAWTLQAYGQFEVGDVDELDFSEMPLDVLRRLMPGELAPEITGNSADGGELALSDLRGKYVLLAFGLTSSPSFEWTTLSLKKAARSPEIADQLSVLTVTVDDNEKAVAEFNKTNGVDWHCLNLGKWDRDTLESYGLKSVPSLWLIDAKGKIAVTGQQFAAELRRSGSTAAELVEDAIGGRLTIGSDSVKDK